jgi:hypothetical protein
MYSKYDVLMIVILAIACKSILLVFSTSQMATLPIIIGKYNTAITATRPMVLPTNNSNQLTPWLSIIFKVPFSLSVAMLLNPIKKISIGISN